MSVKMGPLLLALGKDKQEISVCSLTTTVGEALRSMAERGTLSLPILDDPTHNKFVGFVDVMSLVRALVLILESSENPVKAMNDFNKARLDKILPQVEDNPDSCVSRSLVLNATFKDALVPFTMAGKGSVGWHVHRLLIITDDGRLAALFTQSDALQMLSRNPALLGRNGKKSLMELGLAPRKISTVPSSKSTLEALKVMVNSGHNVVAVVDETGSLVDVLSCSDLRGLNLTYDQLLLPISDFKMRDGAAKKPFNPIFCGPLDLLENAVRLLAAKRLHRLYICATGTLQPVGVVTLTDVLTLLLPS